MWNTSGSAIGNYRVRVAVEPLESEIDTADNSMIDSVVLTIPGDLNGDFAVDIFDAIILANHFGFTRYHIELWDPNVDLIEDGLIDIMDAIVLAGHYSQHYP